MSISDAAAARPIATIESNGATFDVGCLSLADIAQLKREHTVALLETIAAYNELLLSPDASQRTYGALTVILEMSEGIGHAIALAAREPEARAAAAQLPAGTQIRALIEIVKLSASGELLGGAAPKIVDLLTQVQSLHPEEIN